MKNLIVWLVFILVSAWSIWVFVNFPQNKKPIVQQFEGGIGYIDVMNADGTGPWDESKWKIRCFTNRGGTALTCPTFENWSKLQN